MPEVYNKHHKNAPKGAVYIGRPTKWGNPFTHDAKAYMAYASSKTPLTLCKNREEAVSSYKSLILANKELREQAILELKGKDLVCWCAPEACHADVLMEIANEE